MGVAVLLLRISAAMIGIEMQWVSVRNAFETNRHEVTLFRHLTTQLSANYRDKNVTATIDLPRTQFAPNRYAARRITVVSLLTAGSSFRCSNASSRRFTSSKFCRNVKNSSM